MIGPTITRIISKNGRANKASNRSNTLFKKSLYIQHPPHPRPYLLLLLEFQLHTLHPHHSTKYGAAT